MNTCLIRESIQIICIAIINACIKKISQSHLTCVFIIEITEIIFLCIDFMYRFICLCKFVWINSNTVMKISFFDMFFCWIVCFYFSELLKILHFLNFLDSTSLMIFRLEEKNRCWYEKLCTIRHEFWKWLRHNYVSQTEYTRLPNWK